MKATLSYGFGQDVTVPVHEATLADVSDRTIRDAIDALLAEVTHDDGGTATAIREAMQDPRSVVEVKTDTGYVPVMPDDPARLVLNDREHVVFQVSRPHAGG